MEMFLAVLRPAISLWKWLINRLATSYLLVEPVAHDTQAVLEVDYRGKGVGVRASVKAVIGGSWTGEAYGCWRNLHSKSMPFQNTESKQLIIAVVTPSGVGGSVGLP